MLTARTREGRIWILGGIAALVVLYLGRGILAPFFVSFLLAYFLEPLIVALVRRGVPRTVSIVVFLLLTLFLLVLVVLLLYPPLASQAERLIENLPLYLETMRQRLAPVIERLGVHNPEKIKEYLQEILSRFGALPVQILTRSTRIAFQALTSVVGFILFLVNLLIIPVVTFYLLKDWEKLMAAALALIPVNRREGVEGFLDKVNHALKAFLRGQALIALIEAALYSVGYTAVGVPLGLLLGVVTGLANLVPYLGLVIGLFPALLLTYIQFGSFSHLLGVLIVFGVVQGLETGVFYPKIMGGKVGLHPVAILLAVVVGGKLFGFLGILFAVPGAAVVSVILREILERYRHSLYYSGPPVDS